MSSLPPSSTDTSTAAAAAAASHENPNEAHIPLPTSGLFGRHTRRPSMSRAFQLPSTAAATDLDNDDAILTIDPLTNQTTVVHAATELSKDALDRLDGRRPSISRTHRNSLRHSGSQLNPDGSFHTEVDMVAAAAAAAVNAMQLAPADASSSSTATTSTTDSASPFPHFAPPATVSTTAALPALFDLSQATASATEPPSPFPAATSSAIVSSANHSATSIADSQQSAASSSAIQSPSATDPSAELHAEAIQNTADVVVVVRSKMQELSYTYPHAFPSISSALPRTTRGINPHSSLQLVPDAFLNPLTAGPRASFCTPPPVAPSVQPNSAILNPSSSVSPLAFLPASSSSSSSPAPFSSHTLDHLLLQSSFVAPPLASNSPASLPHLPSLSALYSVLSYGSAAQTSAAPITTGVSSPGEGSTPTPIELDLPTNPRASGLSPLPSSPLSIDSSDPRNRTASGLSHSSSNIGVFPSSSGSVLGGTAGGAAAATAAAQPSFRVPPTPGAHIPGLFPRLSFVPVLHPAERLLCPLYFLHCQNFAASIQQKSSNTVDGDIPALYKPPTAAMTLQSNGSRSLIPNTFAVSWRGSQQRRSLKNRRVQVLRFALEQNKYEDTIIAQQQDPRPMQPGVDDIDDEEETQQPYIAETQGTDSTTTTTTTTATATTTNNNNNISANNNNINNNNNNVSTNQSSSIIQPSPSIGGSGVTPTTSSSSTSNEIPSTYQFYNDQRRARQAFVRSAFPVQLVDLTGDDDNPSASIDTSQLPLSYSTPGVTRLPVIGQVLDARSSKSILRGERLLSVSGSSPSAATTSLSSSSLPSSTTPTITSSATQSDMVGKNGGGGGGNTPQFEVLHEDSSLSQSESTGVLNGLSSTTTTTTNNNNNNTSLQTLSISHENSTSSFNNSNNAHSLSYNPDQISSVIVNPLSTDEQRIAQNHLAQLDSYEEICKQAMRHGCYVYRYKNHEPTRRFLCLANNDTQLTWRELTTKEERFFDRLETQTEEEKESSLINEMLGARLHAGGKEWGKKFSSGFKSTKRIEVDDIQHLYYGPFVGAGFSSFADQCRLNNAKSWYALSIQCKTETNNAGQSQDQTLNVVFLNQQEAALWIQGLNGLAPSSGKALSVGKMLWLRVIMKINFIGYHQFIGQTNAIWDRTLNAPGSCNLQQASKDAAEQSNDNK